MGFFQFLSRPREAQPPHADDTVYPTHFIDNERIMKSLVLSWTLRFDDVLDADKLHGALCELLNHGDWRKLGGRLKPGVGRKMEIHVPWAFSKDRPPVGYSHQVFDLKMNEHGIGKKFPKSADFSCIQQGPVDFSALAIPPDSPTTLADFLNNDIPMLSLHIVSFEDATLVSITWPHVLTDASGLRELFRAWSMVLSGRKDEVPRLLGVNEDVVYNIAESSPEGKVQENFKLGILQGFSFVKFVVYQLWDILFGQSMENHTIFLSAKLVKKLHHQAMLDISGGLENDEKYWVSEGDVLVAWISKMVAASLSKPRPITANSVVDIRSRLPQISDAQGGVYVQNMVATSSTPLSVELLSQSLGKIALTNRHYLSHHVQPQMVLKLLQVARQLWDNGKNHRILFGLPDAVSVNITDRSKAGIIQSAEFGPAVLRQGHGSVSSNPSSIASYQHSVLFNPSRFWRNAVSINAVSINGKDSDGNYWLTAYLASRTWAVIKKELAKDLIE